MGYDVVRIRGFFRQLHGPKMFFALIAFVFAFNLEMVFLNGQKMRPSINIMTNPKKASTFDAKKDIVDDEIPNVQVLGNFPLGVIDKDLFFDYCNVSFVSVGETHMEYNVLYNDSLSVNTTIKLSAPKKACDECKYKLTCFNETTLDDGSVAIVESEIIMTKLIRVYEDICTTSEVIDTTTDGTIFLGSFETKNDLMTASLKIYKEGVLQIIEDYDDITRQQLWNFTLTLPPSTLPCKNCFLVISFENQYNAEDMKPICKKVNIRNNYCVKPKKKIIAISSEPIRLEGLKKKNVIATCFYKVFDSNDNLIFDYETEACAKNGGPAMIELPDASARCENCTLWVNAQYPEGSETFCYGLNLYNWLSCSPTKNTLFSDAVTVSYGETVILKPMPLIVSTSADCLYYLGNSINRLYDTWVQRDCIVDHAVNITFPQSAPISVLPGFDVQFVLEIVVQSLDFKGKNYVRRLCTRYIVKDSIS